MENIRGRHNKTKDGTWRTTTLKRQKEPPGNDWEGTFSKAGWKHEERGNQRHYEIPKGPETFLTLDWQPPTSYISNLTSFFLPVLTAPESLYPCFWPQHANLTIVIHPFIGEFDFDILHLTVLYNTWQGSILSKCWMNEWVNESFKYPWGYCSPSSRLYFCPYEDQFNISTLTSGYSYILRLLVITAPNNSQKH